VRIHELGSYAASVIGFSIGAAVGAALSVRIVSMFGSAGTIVGLAAAIATAAVLGALIGGVIGSWGLLRACSYPAAGLTARNIAVGWLLAGALLASVGFDLTPIVIWLLLAATPCICCGARLVAVATAAP